MPPPDETHDPKRRSWVKSANGHPDFPIQNLPLGIFSPPGHHSRPGVAIGDMILELSGAGALLPQAAGHLLTGPTLNPLLALPSADRIAMRRRLSELLSGPAYQP